MSLVIEETRKLLKELDISVITEDLSRPWGGFFVIDETDVDAFSRHFFPDENINDMKTKGKLSPKILFVAPAKRLSWQYHYRRSEIWCCINGSVAVATSMTDEETSKIVLTEGSIIKLKQGERHRLIGLDNWGVIAEIWQHTDVNNPSDENDIVRLQDDFGR